MWDLGQLFVYLLVSVFGCPFVPVPFIERTTTIFLHWIAFAPLLIISWAYLCESVSKSSVLFPSSLFCFVDLCFYTYSNNTQYWLLERLTLERLISHTWFLLSEIVFVILVSLLSHIYFRIVYLYLQNFPGSVNYGVNNKLIYLYLDDVWELKFNET